MGFLTSLITNIKSKNVTEIAGAQILGCDVVFEHILSIRAEMRLKIKTCWFLISLIKKIMSKHVHDEPGVHDWVMTSLTRIFMNKRDLNMIPF